MNFKDISKQTKQLFQNSKHTWIKVRENPPKVYCQSSGVISSTFLMDPDERMKVESAVRKTIDLYMDVVFPAGPGRYYAEFKNNIETPGNYSCKLELSFKHQKWIGNGSGTHAMEALDAALERCRRLPESRARYSDDDEAA
ncbi:hypothetical protein GW916_05250 [bacterium]|nr:hypothetical protein [bacterium]